MYALEKAEGGIVPEVRPAHARQRDSIHSSDQIQTPEVVEFRLQGTRGLRMPFRTRHKQAALCHRQEEVNLLPFLLLFRLAMLW